MKEVVEMSKTKRFIGIHIDTAGHLWVEETNAIDYNDAYEQLERNDSNLIILTPKELEKIYKLVKANRVKGMVRID